jgi:hypothetical protein
VDARPQHSRARVGAARRPSFVVLRIIVSGLWTVATTQRMDRIRVPIVGWPAVLHDPFTWASLGVPPLMFAIILLAVKRLAAAGPRLRREDDRPGLVITAEAATVRPATA